MRINEKNCSDEFEEYVKKISNILDLKIDEVNVYKFSDISDVVNMYEKSPGVMLTPEHIELINNEIENKEKHLKLIPTVIINDYFKYNSSNLYLLGIIAHELRHVWQFYNMDEAKKTFAKHVKSGSSEYWKQQVERDAYAFQLAIIQSISPSSTIKEVFLYFKNIKKDIEELKKKYNDKIKLILKE